MLKYLAYTSSTYITAKLLAESLGIKRSKIIKNYPPTIRWGNSFNNFEEDTEYNNPEFINISSNKLRTYELLSRNSINCVSYIRGKPNEYPVLIRTLLASSKGRGIIIVNNEEEYKEEYLCHFYSPLIKFTNEYRVHILGGKIIKVMEKIPVEENTIIKNSETCTFTRKDINIMRNRKAIVNIVEQLYSVFPIKLAGIDIGIFNGEAYIIEINSAPSLNTYTLELYVNYLRSELCL